MGFSSASAPDGAAPGGVHMSFGDKLLSAIGQANPIANAIGGKLFGEHKLGTYDQGDPGVTAIPTSMSTPAAPTINLPTSPMPDFSMLAQNAQPKSTGIGAAILKALVAG
jgi:hypothetical protein